MPKIGNKFLKSNRAGPMDVSINAKKPKNRSLEKAIAAAVRRSEGIFDNEASDTDSLASSVSSFSGIHGKNAGVSPLNRRKSLRLAMKKNSEVQVVPTLGSQNTVRMETPQSQSLQRMETGSRWTSHRSNRLKSQETVIIASDNSTRPVKLTKGISKWVNYRNLQPGNSGDSIANDSKRPRLLSSRSRSTLRSSSNSVSLLRKKSTTWSLRQMLGATCLNQAEEAGTSKGKRKRIGPLKSISEEDDKNSRLKKEVTFASAASSASSSHEQTPRKSALKRHRSNSVGLIPSTEEEGFLHKTKRMCIEGKDDNTPVMFVANQRDWPVSMEAQVVWRLNLSTRMEELAESRCVFVNTDRCLVGDSSGNVYELDATVTPSRRLELPSGVNCLKSDSKSIFAGCVDGAVYDISDESTTLLWKDDTFQEIKQIACWSDKIAVIDIHGKVAVFNRNSGETIWKEEKFLLEGVGVLIDDTGVYISHKNRLTKYSLDGAFVWGMSGIDFYSTVMTADEVYTCSRGDVHKIDKFSSGNTLSTFNKGRVEVGYAKHCAVGGGLVFVAGKQLVCYDEKSGEVVYNVNLPSSQELVSIQYFQMRLFCLFTHSLEVLDFTEQSIITGKEGHKIDTADITLPAELHKQLSSSSMASAASSVTSQAEQEDANDHDHKPKARRGKLKVKAASIRKNSEQ